MIAFVTGAAHGQGRATALALAGDGYDIVALDVAAPLSYPPYPMGSSEELDSLRAAIEENYDFTQLVGVIAMMGDKQVEEYLGVLEPLLSHVVVTENSWRERVMSAKDLEQVAVRVFGRDRVTCEPDLPDAIQTAVNMVDAEDELGVGYGHGVLICGSFVTAGDARTMRPSRALSH